MVLEAKLALIAVWYFTTMLIKTGKTVLMAATKDLIFVEAYPYKNVNNISTPSST